MFLSLAWASLSHHPVRTLLSALAVGVGIALLLVSKGLAGGSINEVADRMQSVEAEVVILPAQENVIFTSGAAFPGSVERGLAGHHDAAGAYAQAIIPVFFAQARMADQQQRLFGVDPRQMQNFLGHRRLLEGKLFDRAHAFAARIAAGERLSGDDDAGLTAFLSDGLELIIDDRLQQAGKYRVGDAVQLMGQTFRIVGVVEAGVAGRVFAPLQTLREMLNNGGAWSSMFFVKLRPGLSARDGVAAFGAALGPAARVELTGDYGKLLNEAFEQVNLYMTASSGTALVVCFLFILLTMHTAIIERTREIGILKSLGVSRGGLMRLAIVEALLISLAGVAIGVAFAFAAKWGIEKARPLLTVALTGGLVAVAVVLGVLGGVLSALYPGYRAARLHPAAALSYE